MIGGKNFASNILKFIALKGWQSEHSVLEWMTTKAKPMRKSSKLIHEGTESCGGEMQYELICWMDFWGQSEHGK